MMLELRTEENLIKSYLFFAVNFMLSIVTSCNLFCFMPVTSCNMSYFMLVISCNLADFMPVTSCT